MLRHKVYKRFEVPRDDVYGIRLTTEAYSLGKIATLARARREWNELDHSGGLQPAGSSWFQRLAASRRERIGGTMPLPTDVSFDRGLAAKGG